jgi:3-hydroxyacyl-CoA dehydrogenase
VAGGDLRSFDDPHFDAGPYNRTLAHIEALDRPVIAALHGSVLGGGLELALACHARVALPATKLGFPEIQVGVLPGSLGTQRLPRLVKVPIALEMMLTGKPISAARALEEGLVDAVEEADSPRALGVRHALAALDGNAPVAVRLRLVRAEGLKPGFFAEAMADAQTRQRAYPAAQAIVECLQAAVEKSFEEGAQLEAQRFEACRRSRQSRAMRHLFFAQREAARVPGLPTDTARRRIRKVGVVGAGTMGGGIAMSFANIGIAVVVVEEAQAALDRGLGLVRRNYEVGVAKGRMSQQQFKERMQAITGSIGYEDLADCDIVIEAVFEDLALKQRVLKRLAQVCKPGAILATNTSTLDVDVIARASGRPADVVGTHFFSPANVMRLLEVVQGAETAPDVLLTVMDLAKRIGKIAVVSGVCYGFIGNRMAEPYMRENEFLLMEGASPTEIDGAVEGVERVGMAMGPCRMLDMAGIDVGAKTLIELGKAGGLPADHSYRAVCQQLYAQGRAGQKTGSGYYRYSGRTPLPEPATAATCEALAREHSIARRNVISAQEIVERLMLPLINEAAKILEEGIALRPGDIDVVWTAGYGFPDHRGGPLWMADDWGLTFVVERLKHYGQQRGNAHGYWTPSPLLERLASDGRRISDYVRR